MKALYFGAEWCGQCKVMRPRFEERCKANDIPYEIIDVDKDKADLASAYGIRNIPFVVVLDDQDDVQLKGIAADIIDLI